MEMILCCCSLYLTIKGFPIVVSASGLSSVGWYCPVWMVPGGLTPTGRSGYGQYYGSPGVASAVHLNSTWYHGCVEMSYHGCMVVISQ